MRQSKRVWSLRAKLLTFVCLGLVLTLAMPDSSEAFEPMFGQGEGLADNVVLSSSSASMLTRVPSGGLRPGGWLVETGYSRQYDLSDLDQYLLAAAVRMGDFIIAGEAHSFGKADLYSELTGKIMLSYGYDSLVLGGTVSGQLLQFGYGYENLSAVGVGFGLSYRMNHYLLALTGDNLNKPTFNESSLPSEAVYSVYGEYRGQRSFSILAHLRMEANRETQIGFGQRVFVARNGAIFWGLETEPLKYGAGFEMSLIGGRLAYSFSIHPVLGFSHLISL